MYYIPHLLQMGVGSQGRGTIVGEAIVASQGDSVWNSVKKKEDTEGFSASRRLQGISVF